MTGFEMLPRVKAMLPDLPIIMITAYGDAETKRRALELGAEGLLTKPIDFGLLRDQNQPATSVRSPRDVCIAVLIAKSRGAD